MKPLKKSWVHAVDPEKAKKVKGFQRGGRKSRIDRQVERAAYTEANFSITRRDLDVLSPDVCLREKFSEF